MCYNTGCSQFKFKKKKQLNFPFSFIIATSLPLHQVYVLYTNVFVTKERIKKTTKDNPILVNRSHTPTLPIDQKCLCSMFVNSVSCFVLSAALLSLLKEKRMLAPYIIIKDTCQHT